ncbi:MAG TPA: phosphate ABC transporter permease PstA [Thermoanaerobaculaceae bacterium]|nr:phosphate ABC transporter permease PstA [Thermoanaerobaculaceae bacterium]
MSALRRWLAVGTAQRWLTGASVLFALAMIAGLVAVVVETAGAFFWPRPLVEFSLADGSKVLGEVWGEEPDPGAPGGRRLRVKVGNRDLGGADFRWLREAEIRSRRAPADAWLLERREYGNFHGFPRRLRLGAETVDANAPEFSAALARALAGAQRLAGEERAVLRTVDGAHREVARLQLLVAAARRRGGDASGLEARLTRAQDGERRATAPLLGRLGEIRAQRRDATLTMAVADGRERTIPLAGIVRAVAVNTLTTPQKLGLYLSRWWEFVAGEPRESNTEGGIFPAIFGTALMVLLMTVAVVPLGVVTALYLNEVARGGALTAAVRLALANLAGVPSIVFGAFGLAFFVYTVGSGIDRLFFSDVLPTPTFGTGGIVWAALTLALLTLPVVVVATEEGLQSVPQAVRDGARALGATRWQTLRRVVLPYAAPGILTGAILAVARGAGEVAPLMLTGVVKLAPRLPFDSQPPFLHLERKFMHLGFHIYDVGFQSPNVEAAKPMVYATVLVLLVLVVALNLAAVLLRSRLRRRLRGAAV